MPNKKYAVVSGEMWDIIPVLEDGSGPKEYYKDYAEVAARDKIEAIVKAVRGKKLLHGEDGKRKITNLPILE